MQSGNKPLLEPMLNQIFNFMASLGHNKLTVPILYRNPSPINSSFTHNSGILEVLGQNKIHRHRLDGLQGCHSNTHYDNPLLLLTTRAHNTAGR